MTGIVTSPKTKGGIISKDGEIRIMFLPTYYHDQAYLSSLTPSTSWSSTTYPTRPGIVCSSLHQVVRSYLVSEKRIIESLLRSYPDIECRNKQYNGDIFSGYHVESLFLSWPSPRVPQGCHQACRIPSVMDPLWTLTRITELRLHQCHFLGLKDGIGNLSTLKSLCLDTVSCIPKEDLGRLYRNGNLISLELVNCGSIAGAIDQDLGNLKRLYIRNVVHSSPKKNELEGLKKWENVKNLQFLHLSAFSNEIILDLFSKPWHRPHHVITSDDDTTVMTEEKTPLPSSSLKELRLMRCYLKDSDCARILKNLPPSLESLHLNWNRIRSLRGFWEVGLPQGIRVLSLDDTPVMSEPPQRLYLECLLNDYPQLGEICSAICLTRHWNHSSLIDDEILYKLFRNRSGVRQLLLTNRHPCPVDGSSANCQQVPSSLSISILWPMVLERIAKKSPEEITAHNLCPSHGAKRLQNMYDTYTGRKTMAGIRTRLLYDLIREHPTLLMSNGQSIIEKDGGKTV